MLGTGRSLSKILIGAALMAALEIVAFNFLGIAVSHGEDMTRADTFNDCLVRSKIIWIYLVISFATTVISVITWKNSLRPDETYDRIRIKRNTSFLMTSLAAALVYLFFWLVQGMLVILLYKTYSGNGETLTDIGTFISLHDDPLLAVLFPLNRPERWLITIVRIFGIGVSCATFEYREYVIVGAAGILLYGYSMISDGYGRFFPLGFFFMGVFCTILLILGNTGFGRNLVKGTDTYSSSGEVDER